MRDATLYKGQIILATDKGSVYAYNLETETLDPIHIWEPKKTCSHGKEENGKRVQIMKVSAGLNHIIYLSTKREIWVQGKGPALGLFTNKIENEITNPTRVDFFKGRKVLQAEAGHFFTIALVEALPPMPEGTTSANEPLVDLDSYVKVCDQCRKETGDRVLFEDMEEMEKCPLGLGLRRDGAQKTGFLSPTPSSCGNALEEGYSSDHLLDITSGETSCNGTTLNSPSAEIKSLHRSRKHSSDDFEIVEGCLEEASAEKSYSINMTKHAAKNIFKPFMWVRLGSSMDAESAFGIDSDRLGSVKYPIDNATELLRENVASAVSLVATSVHFVGGKVGKFSRHFGSTDSVQTAASSVWLSPDRDSLNLKMLENTAVQGPRKTESHEWNSLPRHSSAFQQPLACKKTHIRTASAGRNHSKVAKEGLFVLEKSPGQIERMQALLIETGKNILNSEVRKARPLYIKNLIKRLKEIFIMLSIKREIIINSSSRSSSII